MLYTVYETLLVIVSDLWSCLIMFNWFVFDPLTHRHSSSGALSASSTNIFRSTPAVTMTPTLTTMMTPVSPSRHEDDLSTDSLNSYLQRVERIQQNLTAGT